MLSKITIAICCVFIIACSNTKKNKQEEYSTTTISASFQKKEIVESCILKHLNKSFKKVSKINNGNQNSYTAYGKYIHTFNILFVDNRTVISAYYNKQQYESKLIQDIISICQKPKGVNYGNLYDF